LESGGEQDAETFMTLVGLASCGDSEKAWNKKNAMFLIEMRII